jgi:excisionase family DNA binding protein
VDDLLTAKQLQDLLRVDRITIYRMLDDGRLRGFKVGGQWRFSRRDIEAWLQKQQAGSSRTAPLALPAESAEPSSQVLPMTCIQAIQAVCAEALDIAIVTTGLDGVPLTGIDNSCRFCDLILSVEPGRLRCAASWRQPSNGQVHPCHAGLHCVSFPVAVGGQPVAIAAACQFATAGSNGAGPAWQPDLPALAAGLGLVESDLRAAVDSVRLIPESQLSRVVRLLRRVADTFSEIGQERVKLLGRLEKIAEMSKI